MFGLRRQCSIHTGFDQNDSGQVQPGSCEWSDFLPCQSTLSLCCQLYSVFSVVGVSRPSPCTACSSLEGGSSYHAADVFFRLIGHNSLHHWCLQWCVYDTTVVWHWLVNSLAFSLHFYLGRCSWAPKTNKCFCDSFRLASCMLLSTYQMRTLVLFSICNDRSNLCELVVIVHVLRLVCISGLQKLKCASPKIISTEI